MATTLLTAGIACIIAAIVGGGLKAYGLEIPALASLRRQIALGLFGAALLAAAAVASRDGILSGAGQTDDQVANTSAGAPSAASSGDCFASTLGAVPANRLKRVESGTADFVIVAPNETKEGPVAVVIEDRRRPIGAIAFEYFAGSGIFKIDRVIDADCRVIDAFKNSSRPGGETTVLQNWDSVEMTFGAGIYALRLGYSDGTISGSLTSVTR